MTNLSRILLVLNICVLPFPVAAYVIEAEYDHPQTYSPVPPAVSSSSSESSASSVSPEVQKWHDRLSRTEGFWGRFMNNRKVTKAFREQHVIRREKRKDKRLQCRSDIRKANRDSLLPETGRCFKATLTMDLEILRKEAQYVEGMAGISDQYRTAALFHIQNLSDAISTVIEDIDAGVYTSKEDIVDAAGNLESHYRQGKRTAMTELRVDRSITWLQHLMVRLHNVLIFGNPQEGVVPKIEEAIACLEQKESLLDDLFGLEDHSTLIESFRQVQSEIKFCTEMAVEAHRLNKELEQTAAENNE